MPKVVDHETRREEVLEATWRVMARSGVDGTNLRDIAAEAGYSTGVIAHYFRNKDDVVRSALRRVWRREAERIQDRTEGLEGLAARERTVAQVRPFGEERRLEMAVWMSFWSSAVADERLAAEQAAYYGQWRARLRTAGAGVAVAGRQHRDGEGDERGAHGGPSGCRVPPERRHERCWDSYPRRQTLLATNAASAAAPDPSMGRWVCVV